MNLTGTTVFLTRSAVPMLTSLLLHQYSSAIDRQLYRQPGSGSQNGSGGCGKHGLSVSSGSSGAWGRVDIHVLELRLAAHLCGFYGDHWETNGYSSTAAGDNAQGIGAQ
jgi:hypothetical protein